MTDQDTAYLQATIREQRAEIEALLADKAHLSEVVGRQSTRLEAQARELAGMRGRIAVALDVAADPDRYDCCESCRVEAITDALDMEPTRRRRPHE